ncbi:MAG: SOS response-associated peptidase [Clostridiales bacterium]|nr:SOS response-associated peptidase [Clostridiales bacterium]
MCGRFVIGGDFRDKLNDLLAAEGIMYSDLPYRESGQDVFPSEPSLVIYSGGRRLLAGEMLWGFSNPYRKGLVINARAETVLEKNLFADSVMNRRCIIPASGFFEWDPYKARYRFADLNNQLILLAGIYHEEQGKHHYTILTTQANESMLPVHDRMPVMIRRDEIKPWLNDSARLTDFLERPQVQLMCEQDSGQIRMDFGNPHL